LVSGIWYLVFWYVVFGIWYLVFGIWLVFGFGIWYSVFGIWYLAPQAPSPPGTRRELFCGGANVVIALVIR
jgi:hypothetical protein